MQQNNPNKKNLYLIVNGRKVSVSTEVHQTYIRGERKIRYMEINLKSERVRVNPNTSSVEILPSRETSLDHLLEENVQFADSSINVEETVEKESMREQLHWVLAQLNEQEKNLICMLYFAEVTERNAAEILGITQGALHKKKRKILDKMKKLLQIGNSNS